MSLLKDCEQQPNGTAKKEGKSYLILFTFIPQLFS